MRSPRQRRAHRAAAGAWPLLLLGYAANRIVVNAQFGPHVTSGCCDLDQAGADWQNAFNSDDETCNQACTSNLCGSGHTAQDNNPDVITCRCYHRQTPVCNSPCEYTNNGECDELPGVDGMGALCARGTDEADCRAPDVPHAYRQIRTSMFGTPTSGMVEAAGERAWFLFTAEEGRTYVIQAAGQTLDDPYLQLYDYSSDTPTLLAQNDDDPEGDGSLDSFIEWTCAEPGQYLVSVKGFLSSVGSFTVTISLAGAHPVADEQDGGAAPALPVSGDPCAGGSTWTQSVGEIVFTPDERTEQVCSWSIICPDPQEVVSVAFNQFQLSRSTEYVELLDGPSPYTQQRVHGIDGEPLPQLRGSDSDLTYETGGTTYSSTGSALTIHFQSLGTRGRAANPGDHFTASYMCARHPQGANGGHSPMVNWWQLTLLSIALSIMLCFCSPEWRSRRARGRAAATTGRVPLVPAIDAVATPVDIETSQNPMVSPTVVTATSADISLDGGPGAGLPSPSPISRTGSSLTGRWECPVCHRENAAYRTRCEGCPGPTAQTAQLAAAVTGTAVAVDVGGGGAGAPLVVQSSAVLGVAMETLNSLLRACSLEAFEGSLQELGVVESDDLRTLSDEQLNSLGMKPVEIERLRRRLQ